MLRKESWLSSKEFFALYNWVFGPRKTDCIGSTKERLELRKECLRWAPKETVQQRDCTWQQKVCIWLQRVCRGVTAWYWAADSLHWTADSLHWAVDNLYWTVDNLYLAVDNLYWAVDNLYWAVDNLYWAAEVCRAQQRIWIGQKRVCRATNGLNYATESS